MNEKSIILESWAGRCEITEPVLIELLEHSVMQRLKGIEMGGCVIYVVKDYRKGSRFEHSVNVLILLRRYGAPLLEQIAGLLHDVSHTAFSHVAEFVFNHKCNKNSYQDDIHEWFLRKQQVDVILNKYDIELDDVLHKTELNGGFKRLEQDLPDICIDRLEYNLAFALSCKIISVDAVQNVLNDLKFEDGYWFFTNPESAKVLGEISMFLTEEFWASAWNNVLYYFVAEALKKAFDLGVVTSDDMHFSHDALVWQKLISSQDEIIKNMMQKVQNFKEHFELTDEGFDQKIDCKFRGIDPLVLFGGQLSRLTEIDPEFKQEFEQSKERVLLGHKVKFK